MARQLQWTQASSMRFLDHTQLNTPLSVGILWTSDRPIAESPIRQYTSLTRVNYTCLRQDSNPQSQQASGHRPSIQTSRPLTSAINLNYTQIILCSSFNESELQKSLIFQVVNSINYILRNSCNSFKEQGQYSLVGPKCTYFVTYLAATLRSDTDCKQSTLIEILLQST